MSERILIVGAGLYGSVCARELTDAGHSCLVLERRDRLGGHCYTRYVPEADCHVHVEGPHIFHTKSQRVWCYINKFARFNNFVNRPKVRFGGSLYSFPINLFTLYQIFGVTTPAEAKLKMELECKPIERARNMEEWCLANLGTTLYTMFIEGYSLKQWGRHPRELPPDIITRLPVRFTFDDNYFDHPYQGIPIGGYTQIFERLLEGVPISLNYDFLADRDDWIRRFDTVVYTGAIDEFFDYELGALEYRSLRFETELLDIRDFQGTAVINYTEASVPFTRIVEHKHFDQSYVAPKTVITREFPDTWVKGKGAYYPVNTRENQERLARYRVLALEHYPTVIFGGRLGTYSYLDMDKVIGAALAQSRQIVEKRSLIARRDCWSHQ
jgi:UDP-galactopyranose mutase